MDMRWGQFYQFPCTVEKKWFVKAYGRNGFNFYPHSSCSPFPFALCLSLSFLKKRELVYDIDIIRFVASCSLFVFYLPVRLLVAHRIACVYVSPIFMQPIQLLLTLFHILFLLISSIDLKFHLIK